MARAAAWLRVSTDDQDVMNQWREIKQICDHRGHRVIEKFSIEESAYKVRRGGKYQVALDELMLLCHKGVVEVVVVWALDRLSRGGAEDTLRIIRRLREEGAVLISVQEPWLNTSPEIQDVLVAFAGWVAQQESKRRSERTKAGMARAKEKGVRIGRPVGAKDRRPRMTRGYYAEQQRRREIRWDELDRKEGLME